MKYKASFFRSSFPEWKRKRDPFMVKILYRPVSFYLAAFFANLGCSANDVSNISAIEGLLACLFLVIPNYYCGIIGAFLVILWICLDCTDGNIARSIQALPYGEFVDATSCYILVGVLFNILGFRAFFISSHFFLGNPVIILCGAMASTFDTLMRLVYQRYLVASDELQINKRTDHDLDKVSKFDRIRMKIDLNVGIGGFLPIFLLISIILSYTEFVIIGWMIYYGLECIGSILLLVTKATKYGNQFRRGK